MLLIGEQLFVQIYFTARCHHVCVLLCTHLIRTTNIRTPASRVLSSPQEILQKTRLGEVQWFAEDWADLSPGCAHLVRLLLDPYLLTRVTAKVHH
jgi:hypothetical protein